MMKEVTTMNIPRFHNFVVNSFIKNAISFSFFKKLPAEIRSQTLNSRAEFLRNNCKFLAHEEDGVIYSWLAYRESRGGIYVYFCYTKYPFQNKGLVKEMLKHLEKKEKKMFYCIEKNISLFSVFKNYVFKGGCW